ncbi:uncharacterized protein F4822DRAFT_426722 [Hypoxylon trugodes]|uniref:uncharacterized protein n=1 Tax=Hypoxylon trugodes TaxID=326681 RepID=UPI00218EEC1F|nr:uncharacterized protein F4822DRAFT_426722 [Hypoxylon trugodes]KAI1390875.1 hypothetical protein F4822DRAFT_426722 [Hypoxylon trugodes]
MARRLAKSVISAEKRALAGENESQDSQEQLVKHMLNHGVGVLSSSPVAIEHFYQSKGNTTISSLEPKGPTKTLRISHSLEKLENESELIVIKQPQIAFDASNALNQPNAVNNPSKISSQLRPKPNNPLIPCPSRLSLLPDTRNTDPIDFLPIPNDATEHPGQLIGDHALLTRLTLSAPREKTEKMSSDSPTQSNDGRSYDQYAEDNSQPQISSQASSIHEHGTIRENDTGFLDFKGTHYDEQESAAEEEAETNFANDRSRRPKTSSNAPDTSGHYMAPPETPAIAQRLFQHGGNGAQLMAASQLFGQTQWTSAVRKASPTSSRPSPDVFNQNTMSPNPVVSSPLKNRGLRTSPTQAFTSSPGFPGVSSRPSEEKTPSAPNDTHEDEGINQGSVAETPLPRFQAPKRRNFLEPISEYRSSRRQSSEPDAPKSPSQSDGQQDSDSDIDTASRRRYLAKIGREKAAKTFPSISLPRSSSNKGENVEVPSTSRVKPVEDRKRTDSERYLAQCHGQPATDNEGSQKTVADSQEIPRQPQRKGIDSEANPQPSGGSTEKVTDVDENARVVGLPDTQAPISNVEYGETVPETSPPSTSMGLPRLLGDIMAQNSSIRSEAETVSLPALPSTDPQEQLKETNDSRPSSLPEQLPSDPMKRRQRSSRIRPPFQSSPTVVLASSPQSATRRSARLGKIVTPQSVGRDLQPPSDIGTRTSTLSSLSATPVMSTPNTEPERVSAGSERQSSSPAAPTAQRRGRLLSSLDGPSSSLPRLRTYSRSRESTRRSTRHSSISTDELAKSQSPLSTATKQGQKPPTRKPARQSLNGQHQLRESVTKPGIFEGMVFALSFQSGQVRKSKEKNGDRGTIERMIRQEGGKILSDGFDELFKFDSFQATNSTSAPRTLSSSLTLLNRDTGFAALIADGHSRKVKYMQALALGIPCLAPKWIMSCISKKEIVDWSSYLLCAGPSALLGEAIRSRNLRPYDASTIKLVDVINTRPKLLDEARILLVMKRTKNEDKRLPYVFLAQVLGGSLVRVHSLEEARTKLRDEESQDHPFDWVYVDDHLQDAQNALFGSSAGNPTSKKRKRQSAGPEELDKPPKRIRTLNDELVIQSLILGRLIEDGEMDD